MCIDGKDIIFEVHLLRMRQTLEIFPRTIIRAVVDRDELDSSIRKIRMGKEALNSGFCILQFIIGEQYDRHLIRIVLAWRLVQCGHRLHQFLLMRPPLPRIRKDIGIKAPEPIHLEDEGADLQ